MLLFLGSWRATLIIAVSIPLAVLTSLIALSALGIAIVVITDTKLNNAIAFPGGGTLTAANAAYVHFTNYEVNAHYSLTSALTLGAAYTFTDGKFDNAGNAASPKWNQLSLLSDYALSNRTDVYAVANWSHLSGGLNSAAPGNSSLTAFEGASSYVGGIAATKNQVVVGAGLRTRF
ncbi:porin [Paraburkholderia sprentiae WSM5005]|uniref:Porin n=1 Tax=Paraburkholderia sprentiae WSM5005 TaxID=754502 RepID=A0A1L1P7E7_9BURK|nr:porin [Paraburkholderia sprentiae WSM5005]